MGFLEICNIILPFSVIYEQKLTDFALFTVKFINESDVIL